jgi:hypothetical protein
MRRAAFGVRVDPRSTPGSQWQRSHAFTAEALARVRPVSTAARRARTCGVVFVARVAPETPRTRERRRQRVRFVRSPVAVTSEFASP